MLALLFCSLVISFAMGGYAFLALTILRPAQVRSLADWVIAGCPASWLISAFMTSLAKRLAKWIEPHLTQPEPVVLGDESRVFPRWSNPHSKHQKCLHAQRTKEIAQAETITYLSSVRVNPVPVKKAHETVYQPRVFHPTESFVSVKLPAHKTKAETHKTKPVEIPQPRPFVPVREQVVLEKVIQSKQVAKVEPVKTSRLDAATAALDNCGLQDMLKALGCKLPRNVGTAADYRNALLEAVEGALYREPKKVKV